MIGLGQGMTSLPDESKVVYRSKDGKSEKTFDALDWLGAMCSRVPNRGEQMVRYYGYYSNVCRGQRKKANEDGLVPCILQPEESPKEYRKNWARFTRLWRGLIQKRGACPGLDPGSKDPLTSPRCYGPMRVISFIENKEVIRKIRPGKSSSTWDSGRSTRYLRRVAPKTPKLLHP